MAQRVCTAENEEFRLKNGDLIGALDSSSSLVEPDLACVTLAVLEYPSMEVHETLNCSLQSSFQVVHDTSVPYRISAPYIAGLLSFREADSYVELVQQWQSRNEEMPLSLLIVDGNGLLHPRSMFFLAKFFAI